MASLKDLPFYSHAPSPTPPCARLMNMWLIHLREVFFSDAAAPHLLLPGVSVDDAFPRAQVRWANRLSLQVPHSFPSTPCSGPTFGIPQARPAAHLPLQWRFHTHYALHRDGSDLGCALGLASTGDNATELCTLCVYRHDFAGAKLAYVCLNVLFGTNANEGVIDFRWQVEVNASAVETVVAAHQGQNDIPLSSHPQIFTNFFQLAPWGANVTNRGSGPRKVPWTSLVPCAFPHSPADFISHVATIYNTCSLLQESEAACVKYLCQLADVYSQAARSMPLLMYSALDITEELTTPKGMSRCSTGEAALTEVDVPLVCQLKARHYVQLVQSSDRQLCEIFSSPAFPSGSMLWLQHYISRSQRKMKPEG